MNPAHHIALLCLPVALGAASTTVSAADSDLVAYTEQREPCDFRSPTRNAYFGDLHIHTGFSYDALPLGIKTTPADAYRFARGEPLAVPPFDAAGTPQATMQLRVPLDFAAVTDHAEFFGEYALCTDTGSDVYDVPSCKALRGKAQDSYFAYIRTILAEEPERIDEVCGADGTACRAASVAPWTATQEMAEAAYDRSSACAFTSFIGYEHTGTPNASNAHRNVIFRNSVVPERAISYIDAPTAPELWAQLTRRCLEGLPGCDVLAIPHNSNISAGVMFAPYAGTDASTALALGERVDRDGTAYDIRFCEEGEVGTRGFARFGCISRHDFFRSVLLTGLQDEAGIGVNSYRLGAIGSTDTHTSASGATEEKTYLGHLVPESTLAGRLEPSPWSPQRLDGNPGGLAGVWAVENSRDALFDAMERREVFGTSGTRIRPRLFAGWDLDLAACDRNDLAAHGYEHGVPMGGDLGEPPRDEPPRFLLTAMQDPNAAPLEKLQLIKGWVDAEGRSHNRVIDVVQSPMRGAVDLASGQSSGGAPSLCGVFVDDDFDPGEPAYYYLRAVEVPTLRWSWAQCIALAPGERPPECENDAPKIIREMAWSSPVWYSAAGLP